MEPNNSQLFSSIEPHLTGDYDLTLTIRKTDDTMNVVVASKPVKESSTTTQFNLKPLVASGTAAELDGYLVSEIVNALKPTSEFMTNLATYAKDVESKKEALAKKKTKPAVKKSPTAKAKEQERIKKQRVKGALDLGVAAAIVDDKTTMKKLKDLICSASVATLKDAFGLASDKVREKIDAELKNLTGKNAVDLGLGQLKFC